MPGMMSLDSPEYFDQQEEIKRQQYMAQMLQKKALDSGGGMGTAPGGFVPRRSPTEGLAQIMAGYLSGKSSEDAKEQQKVLAERMRTDRSSDMSAMVKAMQGSPGGMQADAADNVTQAPAVAAGRLDPSVIGQMRSPQMQQMAMQQLIAQMQPKAPIKAGPGDQLIDPTTFKPVATIPFKPDKPAEQPAAIREYEYAQKQGFKGSFQDFQIAQKKAGATTVNVSQSTEKKYGEQFAGQIAKADSDMRDAAIKAPQLAERSNQIKQLLASGNVKTGTAADFRLQFAKAAQLAGFGDGSAAATEQVSVALAQNTLDAIKASGLGSGSGFSNADRDFLEKAVGGKITLERPTLERLADLSHKAATATAQKWNTRVKQIPKTALEGTGITQEDVKVPQLFGSKPAATSGQDNDPLGLRR